MHHFIRRAAIGALAFLALIAAPALAGATALVRIEYVHGDTVYSSQALSVGSTAVAAAAQPSINLSIAARITVLSGAVVASQNGTATQTNGKRVQAGLEPLIVNLTPGVLLSLIEAADSPAPVSFSMTVTGVSAPFTPMANKPFNINFHTGTGVGSCTLLENVDGSGYLPVSASGFVWPALPYSGAGYTDAETLYQSGVPLELSCVVNSGTIAGSLTQND